MKWERGKGGEIRMKWGREAGRYGVMEWGSGRALTHLSICLSPLNSRLERHAPIARILCAAEVHRDLLHTMSWYLQRSFCSAATKETMTYILNREMRITMKLYGVLIEMMIISKQFWAINSQSSEKPVSVYLARWICWSYKLGDKNTSSSF